MGSHAGGDKLNWVLQNEFDPESTGVFSIPVQESGRHRAEYTGRHRQIEDPERTKPAMKPVSLSTKQRQSLQIGMMCLALVTVGSLIGVALNGNSDVLNNSKTIPWSNEATTSSIMVTSSVAGVIETPRATDITQLPTTENVKTSSAVPQDIKAAVVAPAPSVAPFCDDKPSCQAYARTIVPSDQWNCFNTLIEKESGWRPFVWNEQGSGAFGLVQALPAGKMSSEGSDWQTNGATQLRWGLSYMNERYGGPCMALQFHLSHNWY